MHRVQGRCESVDGRNGVQEERESKTVVQWTRLRLGGRTKNILGNTTITRVDLLESIRELKF